MFTDLASFVMGLGLGALFGGLGRRPRPTRTGCCAPWLEAARGGRVRPSPSGRLVQLGARGASLVKTCPFCKTPFYDELDCLTPAGRDHRDAANEADRDRRHRREADWTTPRRR